MTKITSETIKALIAQKYSDNKYATFFELRSDTDVRAASIDAFVMNVWPSSYARYAFEIKVSRADLMHELSRPEKRAWSMDISNEFWYVCVADICKPDEIPESCGLMVASKNGRNLRVIKRAQWRESQPLEVWEIASIIRAASRMQKYPETLIWLRAGEEINIDELDAIARMRRSHVDSRDLEQRAEEIARDIFEKQNSDMAKYVLAMQEAGIEPPDFMLGKGGHIYDSTIKRWIDKNLVIGPGANEILKAVGTLKTAGFALQSARDSIIKLTGKKDNGAQEGLPGT